MSAGGAPSKWERRLARDATDKVLPFLLRRVDPANVEEDGVRAAALIALARCARDGSMVHLLLRHAADPHANEEVRESAVLGLGLLRRTDPSARIDPEKLAGVRRLLLALLDDKDVTVRVRSFAALSLGLLADQPYPDDPFARDGRVLVRALWTRLQDSYDEDDLPAALATALGMQPAGGVPDGVYASLHAIATGKAIRGRVWPPLLRSHVLAAYVRLRGPGWLSVCLGCSRNAREHVSVRAAAAIGIARQAAAVTAAERYDAARALLRSLAHESHALVAGLDAIALAALLRADLAAGGEQLVTSLRVDDRLAAAARKSETGVRPFLGLALGLAVHDLTPTTKTSVLVIAAMRDALEDLLRVGRGADDVLGSYAVGLGLAGGAQAHKLLLEILIDTKRDPGLRGHCALALAQTGCATPEVRAALEHAAAERISPRVHAQAVQALALLATNGAATRLLSQMERTRSRHAIAVTAAALGALGDPEACDALLARAGDPVEGTHVRVMAVVALGLICDPEARPSRVLLSAHANYPARTPALQQVFHIQ